ncbi:hypothetical protein AAFC00_003333 [Neodothiora populina]|uniref:Uncharacterized protein n=1 Tax=Neodothiora populina TaxID=2781224 RepID=A0ABR3PAB8_9PEZI
MLSFIPLLCLVANLAFSNAAAIQKRGLIEDIEGTILNILGVLTGTNSFTSDCEAWIGTDGEYISEFENVSGENVTLVVWGTEGSWVNVKKPLITYEMSNGTSLNVSFSSGASGAWAAIYENTTMANGQISETWGEYTFDGQFSTFDVSREVNMGGHSMTIETDGCTSDMDTCVFKCLSGDSCWQEYDLFNCDNGSQTGAMKGTYDGAASGGCRVGDDKRVKTTLL